MELKELGNLLQKQGEAFEAFKAANDQRIDALEKGVGSLSEATVKLAATEEALDSLKSDIDALLDRTEKGVAGAQGEAEAHVAEHKELFTKFLRKGENHVDEARLTELEQKAVSVGVDADGGYALTDEMDTNIGELVRDQHSMRSVCRVIPVGNETYSKLFNQGGASVGWVGETDARPETDSPTLAKVSPFFGEIYANPAVTQKALDDLFFDAAGWLTAEVAEEFADEENNVFLTGNGTNKPKGILTYTMNANPSFGEIKLVTSAASGAIDGDDLIDAIHSIKAKYRNRGAFVMSNLTIAALRKLKDADGQYIWRPGMTAGAPSTLFGYSIVENEGMPDIAASANAVLFGDFQRAYTIADVRGTRVLRDPYTNKPYVHFYTTKRVGGGLMDSRALVCLRASA